MKPKCKKHPRKVKKYKGTLEELAEDIGDLHYEELAKFMKAFSAKIKKDSKNDAAGGRAKLAMSLDHVYLDLKSATESIERAWEISKPFMKNE